MYLGKEDAMLNFLYNTVPGRVILRPLSGRKVSKAVGRFMDSKASKLLIKPFVKKNNIDLEEFYSDDFKCFNDCFTRKIHEELRPVDRTPENLIAPCDGYLSAFHIDTDMVMPAKQSWYTIGSLLGDRKKAARFEDGTCLVFRLTPEDYHRYIYFDSGSKTDNHFISGRLHTVRPVALKNLPVYTENCREYTIMETKNFGTVAQIEVGAMLVGKIVNHQQAGTFMRGHENGMFMYGGSTIILLFEKDKVELPKQIMQATWREKEIPVQMGQVIGSAK